MTVLAGHLVVCALGLSLLALLAFGVVHLCRRDPVQAYRFLVVILVLALALPFAQLLVQGRFADLLTSESPAVASGAGSAENQEPSALMSDPNPLRYLDSYASYDEAAAQRALLAALGLEETRTLGEHDIEAEGPFSMTLAAPVSPTDRPWLHPFSERLAPWTSLWILGVGVMAMLFGRRLRLTRSLVRESLLVRDGPLFRAFMKLAREYGLERRVSLRASVRVSGPCCAGCRNAVLLVPLRDAEAPPSPALIWGMRHELTHIRRGDGLTLALQTVLTALFWFHPAVWWFSSQVDRLRELSCDQLVVLHTGRRKSYALALVDYARPLAAQGAPAGLLPWFGSKSQLKRRIEMLALLTTRPSALHRGLQALAILAAVTLLLGGQVLAAGVWLPQESEPAIAPEPATSEDPAEVPGPPNPLENEIVFIEDATNPVARVADLAACPDRIGVVLKRPSAQACDPYGVTPKYALQVVSVERGYPAERAGIRPGDLLMGFGDDTPLTHGALLKRIEKNQGGTLRLVVGRRGEVLTVLIDLATPVVPSRTVNIAGIERKRRAIERKREALEERIARLEERIAEERERMAESAERDADHRQALLERSLEKIEKNLERAEQKVERRREQLEEKMETLEDLPSEEARQEARRELEHAMRKLDATMQKNHEKLERKARSLQERHEQELRKRRHGAEQALRELELHARAERQAIEQEARRLEREARELESEARRNAAPKAPQPPHFRAPTDSRGIARVPAPTSPHPLDGTAGNRASDLPTLGDLFEKRRAEKRIKDSSRRRTATLERMEAELRRRLDEKLPMDARRRGKHELDGLIRRALETIGKNGDVHLDLHPTIQGNTIYIIVNPHVDAEVLERELQAPKPRRKPAPRRKSKRKSQGKKPAPKLTYQGHLIHAVAQAAADMGPVQIPLTHVDGPVREVLQSLLDRIDRLEERMTRMEEGLRP